MIYKHSSVFLKSRSSYIALNYGARGTPLLEPKYLSPPFIYYNIGYYVCVYIILNAVCEITLKNKLSFRVVRMHIYICA